MQPANSTARKITSWDQRFQQLADFHATFGHCRVSRHTGDHRPLGEWIKSQRKYHRERKLTADQESRLNSLGFDWAPPAPVASTHPNLPEHEQSHAIWEERFIELVAFAAQFGHTRVPKEWAENTRLASWVSSQRNYQRKGTLSAEHKQRLDDIGFVWDARPPPSAAGSAAAKLDTWDLNFAELANYKHRFGTTKVPRHWKENPKLSEWVAEQRRLMHKGQLAEEKVFWLNELGFTA